MNRLRLLILLFGPAPIVLASFGVARWARTTPQAVAGNSAVVAAHDGEPAAADDVRRDDSSEAKLRRACDERGQRIAEQLGEGCAVIVRPPFVVAGNMTPEAVSGWHERTIGPAAQAMANEYFRKPPTEPITVLLFTDEGHYNHYAKKLFDDEGISVYGYYKPHLRTLVMNIGTGGGTLVHELTHALVDFDFPEIPDWFNEGLASLHEQCRIRDDRSGIEGLENWRLQGLQQAIDQGRLRSLKELTEMPDFRGAQVGLNYAQARYLCLFLQRHGKLATYFSQFRARQKTDPQGQETLLTVSGRTSWAELDRAFQDWVMTLNRDG